MEANTGVEEDSDDEWFYDSIRRYDDLLMYDVHGNITSSTFYDNSKVLLGVSRGSVHELLLLSVPDKLLAGRSAGLVRNRDFNLVAAAYTTGSVRKAVRVGSSVVAAQEGSIHLYSIPEANNASDVISLVSTLKEDVGAETVLAVSGDHVFAGDSLANLIQLDLGSQNTHLPVKFANAPQRNGIISEAVSVGDKLYICFGNEGSVFICDMRTKSVIQEVQARNGFSGEWTMDASKDGDLVALASSCGSISVQDVRNTRHELCSFSSHDARDRTHKVTVHLSPSDPLLSVSGFDKTVDIYNFKCGNSESKVFMHDGHRGKGVTSVVTHQWHPVLKNLLLSADDTGKLNAWRFRLPDKS